MGGQGAVQADEGGDQGLRMYNCHHEKIRDYGSGGRVSLNLKLKCLLGSGSRVITKKQVEGGRARYRPTRVVTKMADGRKAASGGSTCQGCQDTCFISRAFYLTSTMNHLCQPSNIYHESSVSLSHAVYTPTHSCYTRNDQTRVVMKMAKDRLKA